ncbi:MAG: hypothetical protein HN794_00655 [Euryarchaeota archaeon]|jgi:hypothetical protein|nr:hypothetical protein [Euryarchaeota archaeon]MBT4924754.1 hypothetical protein [Euryarchaeota archaeon]MBT7459538.1 hypothetical protein [Euryarchaeota archaeon]
MANLWQFFGLPDPEGSVSSKKKGRSSSNRTKATNLQDDVSQQTLIPIVDSIPETPTLIEASSIPKQTITQAKSSLVAIPAGWKGPVSADGEPFHDLGVITSPRRSFPSRALRYVAPDEKKRIPTRGIGQRISTGDTVIVDLRSLVHMDAHQNACRRELKMMCEEIGVEVFSLDAEDKLLMIPGCDVVVDRGSNHLGLNPLM